MMIANTRAETQFDSAASSDDALLKRALLWSVGLHLAVLAAFTVRAVFYPSEPLIADKAIRVDLVGLPDKVATLPPLEPLEPAPAPPPAPKSADAPKPTKPVEMPKPVAQDPGPKVNLNKTKPEDRKREQEAALKRLEAMQKLESMMKSSAQTPPQPAASAAANGKANGSPIRGNEVSRGSSLKGVQRLDHENYVNAVDEHVHRHWSLPQWLANANFKARVLVFVDAQGNVVKKQMTQSSGNQVFDERVMLAIERSSPFPVPPSNLVDILAVDGIEFGFPE
jgi:colicin import membrane protein